MKDRGQHHSEVNWLTTLSGIAAAATVLIVGEVVVFALGGGSDSGAPGVDAPGVDDNSAVAIVDDDSVALPDYAMAAPQSVREAYVFAAQRPDVMRWIPCYCGCGGHSGHKSALNCFVSEDSTPAQIEWDEHGAWCDMCVNIVLDSKSMTADGKSLMDVRTSIDDSYSYIGPGTDTLMPPG